MSLQEPSPSIDQVWTDGSLSPHKRVAALMNAMTIDEKINQLVGYWFDKRGPGEIVAPMQDSLGAKRLPFEEVAPKGLGHFTRVLGTEPGTTSEIMDRLRENQQLLLSTARIPIPAIAHEECLTGVNAVGATVYPAPLSWGATFDPTISASIGDAIGKDLAALGVHQGLSPVLDVVRDYRWGRVEETISEDPLLVGCIGSNYVSGLENNGIVATLKHFVGYSASVSGRNHAPVSVGARELADILLIPFEMAVRDTEVRSVMNSYSDIDGVPVAADPDLLTNVLRDQWGFDGTVVSDYWAIPFLASAHGVASDGIDAGRIAIESGIDVELPNGLCYPPLKRLVEEGRLSESIVNRAVERVLLQKAGLGLLDNKDYSESMPAPDLDSSRNRGIAKRAADESVVLLRNSGLLPIPSDFSGRIALIGPVMEDARVFLGCYSYPIHVLPRHPEFGLGLQVQTLAEAIRSEFPNATIDILQAAKFITDEPAELDAALRLARSADLVIIGVGDLPGMFGRGTSGEGCDASDLRLPGNQQQLVDSLAKLDVTKILITNSGRPYAFPYTNDEYPNAIQTFIGGAEGAQAIAGVLSSRINPSGHLPVQIPIEPGGAQHLYLGAPLTRTIDKISSQFTVPAFPFGHGLSYSSFEINDLSISKSAVHDSEIVQLSLTIANIGDRDGSQVVQLYLADPVASIARPVQKLVGFSKVALAPSETAKLVFDISADLGAYTLREGMRVVDPGELIFTVGTSSADTDLSVSLRQYGPRYTAGADRMIMASPRLERA